MAKQGPTPLFSLGHFVLVISVLRGGAIQCLEQAWMKVVILTGKLPSASQRQWSSWITSFNRTGLLSLRGSSDYVQGVSFSCSLPGCGVLWFQNMNSKSLPQERESLSLCVVSPCSVVCSQHKWGTAIPSLGVPRLLGPSCMPSVAPCPDSSLWPFRLIFQNLHNCYNVPPGETSSVRKLCLLQKNLSNVATLVLFWKYMCTS